MGIVTKPLSGIWAEQLKFEPYGVKIGANDTEPFLNQYGTETYVSGPQDFSHTSNKSLPNGVTNADRLRSTDGQQLTWTDRFYEYVDRAARFFSKAPGPVGAAGQTYLGAKAAPKIKDKAKNLAWKLVFIVVIVFVGYFFFKTVAIKYAGKV